MLVSAKRGLCRIGREARFLPATPNRLRMEAGDLKKLLPSHCKGNRKDRSPNPPTSAATHTL